MLALLSDGSTQYTIQTLWSLAHVLVAPSPRNFVLFGGMIVLAIYGAHLQDVKKIMLKIKNNLLLIKNITLHKMKLNQIK